jgi:LacI family transcriptional regulator
VDGGYRIPVVAIDPHTGPSDLPTVDSDNLAGAEAAVWHLVNLGHRRIGFLGGRDDLESARRREEGYRRTMAAAGLPVDPDLMRSGGFRMETSDAPARELLGRADRPTAIFAANDLMAIQTVQVAQSLGLRVPEDLSVIGFDNIPESAMAKPTLTTIAQPLKSIGQTAMQLLLALLRGEEVPVRHVQLATELVVRSSTAPPA